MSMKATIEANDCPYGSTLRWPVIQEVKLKKKVFKYVTGSCWLDLDRKAEFALCPEYLWIKYIHIKAR